MDPDGVPGRGTASRCGRSANRALLPRRPAATDRVLRVPRRSRRGFASRCLDRGHPRELSAATRQDADLDRGHDRHRDVCASPQDCRGRSAEPDHRPGAILCLDKRLIFPVDNKEIEHVRTEAHWGPRGGTGTRTARREGRSRRRIGILSFSSPGHFYPLTALGRRGMVQERPFSGNTWDLSADPDGPALERVYASPWLPCWGFSSARTACTPEVPASERAAHPSATPRGSCRLDGVFTAEVPAVVQEELKQRQVVLPQLPPQEEVAASRPLRFSTRLLARTTRSESSCTSAQTP